MTGYAACTERQKAIVDYMIHPRTVLAKPVRVQIAEHFKCKKCTLRNHFDRLYMHYDIDSTMFNPQVRLVYLRAKELGLI